MKKTIKVYLTTETENKLRVTAEGLGFEGRGWLTHFLEKISKEELVFLDSNVRRVLKAIDLK